MTLQANSPDDSGLPDVDTRSRPSDNPAISHKLRHIQFEGQCHQTTILLDLLIFLTSPYQTPRATRLPAKHMRLLSRFAVMDLQTLDSVSHSFILQICAPENAHTCNGADSNAACEGQATLKPGGGLSEALQEEVVQHWSELPADLHASPTAAVASGKSSLRCVSASELGSKGGHGRWMSMSCSLHFTIYRSSSCRSRCWKELRA